MSTLVPTANEWSPRSRIGKHAGTLKAALLIVAVSLGVMAGVVGTYLLLHTESLPDVSVLETYRPGTITRVHDSVGSEIGQFSAEKRVLVGLDQIPAQLQNAIIAVEDSRFHEHPGLDPRGVMRAMLENLKAGRVVQGGSTLTQQLAKLLFLTPEKSLERKLREALIALRIESLYTKDEILGMYCNQIYLGHGRYGFDAAARYYFGKSVAQLDLAQAALLAGMPQKPNGYSPIRKPEAALKRRGHVLERMVAEGFISREEAERASASPLDLRQETDSTPSNAPYFVEEVRKALASEFGEDHVYREGLSVRTTLDSRLQEIAARALQNGLMALAERQGGSRSEDASRLEGALVALDVKTGKVLAMVGGQDFERSQFNCAVQAPRQPGSAFKPIYYAAAFGQGMTPADTLFDEPIALEDEHTGEVYEPENFSRQFYGLTTLRRALEKSYNPLSVQLLEEIGYDAAIDYARRLGLSGALKPYPSLALGVFETTLLELTGAYQSFAGGGVHCRPYTIEEIRDRDGGLLVNNQPRCRQVLPEEVAYLATHTLRGVIERGTGVSARDLDLPLAGKTGTTDDYADAWFIGYSPRIVCGVWIGYGSERRSLGRDVTGAVAALPVWKEFMDQAVDRDSPGEFTRPANVELVSIDPRTGRRATASCLSPIQEAFVRGTAPILDCTDEMHALVSLPYELQKPLVAPDEPVQPELASPPGSIATL